MAFTLTEKDRYHFSLYKSSIKCYTVFVRQQDVHGFICILCMPKERTLVEYLFGVGLNSTLEWDIWFVLAAIHGFIF